MLVFFAIATLLVLAGRQTVSKPAPPSQLVVGTCLGASPYSTIQSAVSAAPPGGTVLVCPGTYPEQVEITQPLTLKGVQVGGKDAAVITSPSGGVVTNTSLLRTGTPAAAQVLVQNTTEVNITNLTMDGTGNKIPPCGTSVDFIGIYYQIASGTVNGVATRNQLAACGGGIGVYAEGGDGETSHLAVLNSSFHSYNGGGIVANRAGMNATIVGNSIAGIGLVDTQFENGIQIAFGATGKVVGNTVMDNVAPNSAIGPDTGILIGFGNGVIVENNTVGNTNYGIRIISDPVEGTADHTIIQRNTVLATHLGDAIDVCSNHNTIVSNTVNASDESGIHLDSICTSENNNFVARNTLNESCAGILQDTVTTGNTIMPDNLFFNDVNSILHADSCSSLVFDPVGAVGGAHAPVHVIP
jgi:hypothetical protein